MADSPCSILPPARRGAGGGRQRARRGPGKASSRAVPPASPPAGAALAARGVGCAAPEPRPTRERRPVGSPRWAVGPCFPSPSLSVPGAGSGHSALFRGQASVQERHRTPGGPGPRGGSGEKNPAYSQREERGACQVIGLLRCPHLCRGTGTAGDGKRPSS